MRARRWPHILITLLLALAAGGYASTNSEFSEANRLYEQGNYPAAIQKYESLAKIGKVSPALLFNLGNACFKNGELGRAIYCYRRAETLAPRDPDIQANLRFARDAITGSASVQEPAWKRAVGYFRINELASATAICFWILLILLSLLRWRPAFRPTLRPYVTATAVLLVALTGVLAAAYQASRTPVAIANGASLTVHLGPLRESQEAFSVKNGTELVIENRRDDWIQVSDRSSRTGWVEASKVLTLP